MTDTPTTTTDIVSGPKHARRTSRGFRAQYDLLSCSNTSNQKDNNNYSCKSYGKSHSKSCNSITQSTLLVIDSSLTVAVDNDDDENDFIYSNMEASNLSFSSRATTARLSSRRSSTSSSSSVDLGTDCDEDTDDHIDSTSARMMLMMVERDIESSTAGHMMLSGSMADLFRSDDSVSSSFDRPSPPVRQKSSKLNNALTLKSLSRMSVRLDDFDQSWRKSSCKELITSPSLRTSSSFASTSSTSMSSKSSMSSESYICKANSKINKKRIQDAAATAGSTNFLCFQWMSMICKTARVMTFLYVFIASFVAMLLLSTLLLVGTENSLSPHQQQLRQRVVQVLLAVGNDPIIDNMESATKVATARQLNVIPQDEIVAKSVSSIRQHDDMKWKNTKKRNESTSKLLPLSYSSSFDNRGIATDINSRLSNDDDGDEQVINYKLMDIDEEEGTDSNVRNRIRRERNVEVFQTFY